MTAWTSVKMAVVPPTPSASVRTAVIVKTRANPELTQRVAQFADEASQDVCSLTAQSVAGKA